MRHDKFSNTSIVLYICGLIPVLWLALLLAPHFENGLPGLIENFGAIFENPFHIQWTKYSARTIFYSLMAYIMVLSVYLSNDRNYRRREEHGSAKWGSPKAINRKYADRKVTANKVLTQNVAIGLNGRKHRRNLNILCCGGSGAGKTRFFAKPTVMNANTSYVCLDPKGGATRS